MMNIDVECKEMILKVQISQKVEIDLKNFFVSFLENIYKNILSILRRF